MARFGSRLKGYYVAKCLYRRTGVTMQKTKPISPFAEFSGGFSDACENRNIFFEVIKRYESLAFENRDDAQLVELALSKIESGLCEFRKYSQFILSRIDTNEPGCRHEVC